MWTALIRLEAGTSKRQWAKTMALAYGHRSASYDRIADTQLDPLMRSFYRSQAEDDLVVATNFQQLADED